MDQLLLKSVLAEPLDDTVRLAYADCLEEAGRAGWARLIRVQVELAAGNSRPGLCDEEYEAFKDATEDLIGTLGPFWTVDCSKHVRADCHADVGCPCDFVVRRGFVERVRCRMDDWVRHGRDLVRRHPVGRVSLSDRNPTVEVGPLGGYIYTWWCPPRSRVNPLHVDAEIPADIWRLVHNPRTGTGGFVLGFTTADAAYDALSRACLEWASS